MSKNQLTVDMMLQIVMTFLRTFYGSLQLSIVLIFVYIVYAIKGVNKMVDVITNRMFDTFNKFAPRDTHQNESLSTISNLKRFSADSKYRKSMNREAEEKARNAQLFDIKENTPPLIQTQRRPTTGLCCTNCTPSNRDTLVNKTSKNLALKNIINYTPAHKKYDCLHRTFNHLSQVYELKKYDYPQVEQTVIKDERIKHAIEKTAFQQFQDTDGNDDSLYQELLKNNEKRARTLLHDMRSTLSDFLLRFTSWVLYKLLPCFMSSVVVHPGHVEMLKQASKTNLPMIFLPLHRSHLDYILMSFILLNNDIRSPLVASGDNLRIPFFGSLLRGLGAFFIKRRIDPIMGRKDHLYKAILHTYMNESLRAGHNIEFFLEGGRTRTGKPCMPKYGILSVIVESFMDGTIEDALLVPVSINYEKLVDGNFVREQLGQPKEMETFCAAIKGIWNVLNFNHGMMRIDFNQPFSLRELVKTFNTNGRIPSVGFNKKLNSNPSTTSLYGTDVVSDEHKSIVESISKHVIYDCARSQAIMSTNALAFLLLNKFRNGAKVDELVDALDDLKHQLLAKDRDIGFTGDSLDVINYAIGILGPALVRKEKVNNEDMIKPVSMLPNVIELAYYSNAMMTCYALESVVANALFSLEQTAGGVIRQDELVQASVDLCNYLQYEFIFCKPCQNLEVNILDCIQDLINRHDVFITRNEITVDQYRSRRLANELFDGEDEQTERYEPIEYEVNESGTEHMNFLRGLLMPLVEGYAITAFCLDKLVGRTLLENELVTEILDEMRTQLQTGTLKYEESVSVDPVKNALKIYQKLDMLECHAEKKLRLYYLKEKNDNTECVMDFYNKVNQYRRNTQTLQQL